MRSYSIAVLLFSILVVILLLEENDLIEARGSRGRTSYSRSSSSRSSRSSRSSSSVYRNRGRRRTNSRRVITTSIPTSTSSITTSTTAKPTKPLTTPKPTKSPTTPKLTTQKDPTTLAYEKTESTTSEWGTSFWESKRWRDSIRKPHNPTTQRNYKYMITNAPQDKHKTKVSMANIAATIIGTGVFILLTTTFCYQYLQARHTTLSNPDNQRNITQSAPGEEAVSSSPDTQHVLLPRNPDGHVSYAQSQSPAYFSNLPPPYSGLLAPQAAEDPSTRISAPEDAPPPSYHELFKS
ncbi:hypothetical protein ACHWQZ_G019596 [Mnemiopsis leidyi]